MKIINLAIDYTPAQIDILFPKKEFKFTIIPKGRRFGATKGFANGFIEWALDGITPMLWVDTINGNIDRYYERYFEPILRNSNIEYRFNQQKRQLNIFDSIIDFRSSDNPSSFEGFGYKKIFLNEAGIILKDNYLYTNAVLPMLMDFPNSQLYAVGTPKGKIKKDGGDHLFYSLYKKALENFDGNYRAMQFSSYDNPLLSESDIKELENEIALMDEKNVRQEIYGDFIEMDGTNPFAINYNPEIHEDKSVQYNNQFPIYVSMDFNIQPMVIIFSHKWIDRNGYHSHYFDVAKIDNADIDKAANYIIDNYQNKIPSMIITGDYMGKRKDIGQKENASLYLQLERKLRLHPKQLLILPNPTHENSRNDCNYVLKFHPDIKFHPEKCKDLCRDLRTVQVNGFGEIIKSNRKIVSQQADALDAWRYDVNAFLHDWKTKHQKGLIK